MDTALNKTLGSLPADTVVYDGHNYSQGNIKFALSIGMLYNAFSQLAKLMCRLL